MAATDPSAARYLHRSSGSRVSALPGARRHYRAGVAAVPAPRYDRTIKVLSGPSQYL